MARDFVNGGIVDKIVITSSSDIHATTAVTVMFWVYPRGLSSIEGSNMWHLYSDWEHIAFRITNKSNLKGVFFTLWQAGGVTIGAENDGISLAMDQWYHLTGTYDGSTVKLRIYDAVTKITTNYTNSATGNIVNSGNHLHIGNYQGGQTRFQADAKIAEVKYFKNTSLSDSEIDAERWVGYSTRKPNFYMSLSGNSSPEADLSGNGNNGTVTGTTKADHAPVGRYVTPPRYRPQIVVSSVVQVLKQTILKHNIIEAISKATILKHNILNVVQVLKQIILKHNLIQAINKPHILKHNIIEAIQKGTILKHNLIEAIAKSSILKHQIIEAIPKGIILKHNLIEAIQKSTILKHNILNVVQVLKQLILKHQIIEAIAKSTIFKHNTIQAILKGIILKHNIITTIQVLKQTILKHNLLPTLAHPFDIISNLGPWEDTTFGNGDGDLVDELDSNDDDASAITSKSHPISSEIVTFKVQPMTDPLKSTGHTLRIRARSTDFGFTIDLKLKQGSTIIAQINETMAISYQTFEHILTTVEADSITDYENLTFEIFGQQLFGADNAVVSFVEFEVPPTQLLARISKILKHNINESISKQIIFKNQIIQGILKSIIFKHNIGKDLLILGITKVKMLRSTSKVKLLRSITKANLLRMKSKVKF